LSSRDRILTAIRQNKPADRPLPDTASLDAIDFPDRIARFGETLAFIGGQTFVAADWTEAETYIRETYSDLRIVVSTVPALAGLATTDGNVDDPHALADVELAILPGTFAVAENAAVWLPDSVTPHRVLPFICQHLVLVVPANELVSNLHQAYARLSVGESGFGVFIAGPSKTADIEQSLVIGAHGARSLSVILVANA